MITQHSALAPFSSPFYLFSNSGDLLLMVFLNYETKCRLNMKADFATWELLSTEANGMSKTNSRNKQLLPQQTLWDKESKSWKFNKSVWHSKRKTETSEWSCKKEHYCEGLEEVGFFIIIIISYFFVCFLRNEALNKKL